MPETDHLTPEEQENLVAYLDGELEEETARMLEAKLSRSAAARREAEILQRTWELLDYLPRPKAPENFTHRTLQRMAVQQQTMLARLRRRRWLGWTAWATACLAASVLGFLWSYRDRPTPKEVEVQEPNWIMTLPKADRDRLAAAKSPEEKQKLLADIRQREADRELEWQLAQARLEDQEVIRKWMKTEMPRWLEEELLPKLSRKEREQLEKARKNRVPVNLIIRLAERHNVPLPEPLQKLRPAPPPSAGKSSGKS